MKTKASILRFPWFFNWDGGATLRKDASKVAAAPKVGLCLSSGGARGLAHIGVIQVLEEHGIKISAIAGSSMGAYVGSLYAAGYNGSQLEEMAAEIQNRKTLLRLVDPMVPPTKGLMYGEKVRNHLEKYLAGTTFAELGIPLMVVATDLDLLRPYVFESGNVAAAVHASAAIPGVVAPVQLGGMRLIDGGASAPLPVELLRDRHQLDFVIAVNVIPAGVELGECRQPGFISRSLNLFAAGNVLDTFHRALLSAQGSLVQHEAALADAVIHPRLTASRWYEFENFERYIAAGRAAALEAMPAIMANLNPRREPPHETPPHQSSLGLVTA